MSTRQHGSWRFVRWLLAAGGCLAVLWMGAAWLRPQRVLAARVAAELETASPEAIAPHMRQLAAFGDEGMPHLVQALKNERPEIAGAARSVLSEELDRWQSLEHKLASRRLGRLASELAVGIEACSPTTRRMASDLATRILLWSVDAAAIDQQQLIADCERVLVSVRGGEQPTVVQLHVASAISPRTRNGDVSPLDEDLALPGGGLPVEMLRAPSLPPEERGQPRALPTNDAEELLPVLSPTEEPRRFLPSTGASGSSRRSPVGTLERIYQLVSNDVSERDEAENQLRQAGFNEAHLAVARRFADPSAAVREQLARQLAGQTVIDGRPWLLRLLDDEDNRVRLAAASVLATNNDPQTLRQLREKALSESDADVRAILVKATKDR